MSTREGLARFLFQRSIASWDADPALAELAWADIEIHRFWTREAKAVLEYLAKNGDTTT